VKLNNPIVSIIIPVYNVESYLRQCLDAAVSQTYENIEIFLVDDGSKDNSGKLCDEYVEKYNFVKVVHKKNEGVSIARNIGIKECSGDYCLIIDSDDFIKERMVELLIKKALSKEADLVICGITSVDIHYLKKTMKYHEHNFLAEYSEDLSDKIFAESLSENPTDVYFGSSCNKLIKRSLLVENNIYFEPHEVFAEDACFAYKVYLTADKIAIEKEVLYYYRLNSLNSLSKMVHPYQYYKDRGEILEYQFNQVLNKLNYTGNKISVLNQIMFRMYIFSFLYGKNLKMKERIEKINELMKYSSVKTGTDHLVFERKIFNWNRPLFYLIYERVYHFFRSSVKKIIIGCLEIFPRDKTFPY
jgi:glycosyltransferase involved in cell wall biosynthesis